MYQIMRRVGSSAESVELAEELAGLDAPVQGIHIGVDEYYADWFLRHFLADFLGQDLREWLSVFPPPYWHDYNQEILDFIPPWWNVHAANSGYTEGSSPFYFRVILRYSDAPISQQDLPRSMGQYMVQYEERPPAVAVSNTTRPPKVGTGHRIVEKNSAIHGTCGGFLQDFGAGTKYGVTCQHVLPTSGVVLSAGPTTARIGQHSASCVLTPKPSHGFCNPHSMSGAATTDWATFEIDQSVSVSSLNGRHGRVAFTRPIKTISPYMNVEFDGATSKLVKCQTSCLCVWHVVDIGGIAHCFGDLMELRRPPGWASKWTLAKSGDSGAWVIAPRNGPGADWFGMILASDGAQCYACFADSVLREARSELNTYQLGLMI